MAANRYEQVIKFDWRQMFVAWLEAKVYGWSVHRSVAGKGCWDGTPQVQGVFSWLNDSARLAWFSRQ